jgi:hypothetical protein
VFKRKVKESANDIGRKPARRGRWEEIEEGFVRLEKSMADIHLAHRQTEKSLEEVHQAHRKTEKSLEEAHQARRETEESMKNMQITFEEFMKNSEKMMGEFGNTLGTLIEHTMTPDLPRKFREFGFIFKEINPEKLKRSDGSIYAEIDGFLENDTQAMAVEVKTTLREKDVDNHIKRMERIRIHASEKGDSRELFGAMAGAIVTESTRNYALSKGLFLIEPSGEDVKISKPKVEPRRW